jgi:hypothetical protein
VPDVARVGEEIVHFIGVGVDLSEILNRHLDPTTLGVEWIKIHDHENDAVARRRHLAIEKKRAVVAGVETQVVVEMSARFSRRIGLTL